MKAIIAAVARNPVLPNLLMLAILIFGFFNFLSLRRETMPEVTTDIVQIQMSYPGASATEIEEAIVAKIENELNGINGINYISSIAKENVAIIKIILEESVSDKQVVLQDIKDSVNRIPDFPADSENPSVQLLKTKSNAVILVLHGQAPERTLKEMASGIEDELIARGVSQVNIGGTRNYEIAIQVKREVLREFDLTLSEIINVVKQGSVNIASGSIKTNAEEYKIEIKGRKYRAQDYRDLLVKARPDGSSIHLYQVADVNEGFEEGKCQGRFKGEDAVLISVLRSSNEDIVKLAKKIREYVHTKQSTLPEALELSILADFSEDVTKRIDILLTNAWQGLILLFFVLWFFLDFKLAFWVSVGIPISFAFTGGLMGLSGETLNSVTLFGLILVLGIVVDDAIVFSENIHLHQKQPNISSMDAAINGTYEMAWPVIAAITTTILAFMPLFFIEGKMGKFISIMPFVVITTLLGSLFEGLFILPAHLGHGGHSDTRSPLKDFAKKIRHSIEAKIQSFIDIFYIPIFHISLEFRYVTMALIIFFLMCTKGLISGGHIDFVFFPESDGMFLVTNVEFPEGTSFSTTEDAIQKLEKSAAIVNEKYGNYGKHGYVIEGIYSETGGKGGTSHVGKVRLTLVQPENRDLPSKDLLNFWRQETAPINNALKVSFSSEGGMSMAVKDMEVLLSGKNFDTLTAATIDFQNKMQNFNGVYDVESDYKPGKRELNVHLTQQGMIMGITLQSLASQLRQGFFGTEVIRLQRGKENIDVEVKYSKEERAKLGDLYKTLIRTPAGYEVPFDTVAYVKMKRGMSEIKRRDSKRRIRVICAVDKAVISPKKLQRMIQKKIVPKMTEKYPDVEFSFKGANEEQDKSMNSLSIAFITALMGIYLVLAVIFRSYVQPLLIMAAIPFGIVGAVFGHYFIGFPLSMLSVFGIVALSGVVVNDSLVMIERINENIKENLTVWEAVQKAGPRRFRPIIITSVTTIAGLLPLLAEKSLQAQSLKPMAVSLSTGLVFATFLTLFGIPCMYLVLNDIRRAIYWIRSGEWPNREIANGSNIH
ncbi:multidrug transporter [Candidatus Magnetomorum sp. HK-1]|nr:multidrug transporter [Candidatus Magnetomorum sp. HK-1]